MRARLPPFVLPVFACLLCVAAHAEQPAAVDEPSVDEPSVDEPSFDEPSVDEPSVDEPSVDEPSVDEPSVDKPSVEEPSVEEPSVEEPSVEEPSVDEPTVDEPSVDEPSVDEPSVDEPSVDEPSVEEEGPRDLRQRDDGDAIFIGIMSAVASGSGLVAVASTAFFSTYAVTNVFRLGGYTFTRRYWQWGVGFVVVPTLLALIAIPIGSVFGTWWGAGLRGLPLPLVDAAAMMVIGLSLGTLAGTMIAGPPGVLAGGVVGTWMLATGALDYVTLTQGFNTAAAIAFLGAPAIGGVAAALVGSTVGAAFGPVLIAAQWAGGAKADYFDEE